MREKLINICTPRQWKTLSTSELKDEGYTVYGANGVIGYYNEYNHEAETVMVTCRGATCGTVNISKPYSYINGNAMCMDDLRHDINVKYLYYALKNYDFKEVISGSAQPQITRQGLNNVFVEVVDKPRQLEIVKVLSNVEETITRKQQQLAEYDQLIKSRFVGMFGTLENTIYKVESLMNISDLITDGTHQTPTYTDDKNNGYKFLSSKDVTSGKIEWTNIKYIPEELHKELYKRITPMRNDILLAKNGTTGTAALVDVDDVFDIYVSLALIKLKKDMVNPIYSLHAINSIDTKRQFNASLKGVGVPNLHLGEIRKAKIIVPPIDLQNQFVQFTKQVDKLKFVVQQSLDETQKLFDSLMQKHFG